MQRRRKFKADKDDGGGDDDDDSKISQRAVVVDEENDLYYPYGIFIGGVNKKWGIHPAREGSRLKKMRGDTVMNAVVLLLELGLP